MRIVYVSWEFPPAFGGGIATYVHAMSRTLAARGHDVTVVTVTTRSYPFRQTDEGVLVIRLPLVPRSGPEPMATLHAWQTRAASVADILTKLLRADPPDLIEFADYRGEGTAFLSGVSAGERPVCVVRLHTPLCVLNKYNTGHPPDRVLEEYENHAILAADHLVCPSEALVREIREHIPNLDAISILPYPADPAFLEHPNHSEPAEGQEVLYVGRLEERKGVQTLVHAAATFFEACPEARLVMIGGDTALSPTQPSMRRVLLDALPERFHARLELPGAIPRRELVDRYLRAAFCVFPSLFENFPNTCLEAMCLGRPVIGTTNSGMAEMIEDGVSGILVESGDVGQLAEAMIRLHRMAPDQRGEMGRAARRRVIEKYHPDVIAAEVERLYGGMIERHPYRPVRKARITERPRRVAVVIPCFNQGAFLPEAIESVHAQTYPNVECVVVDDGSTDPQTVDVLAEFRRRGIRVVSQENQGLPSARNAGVRATDTDFFVPLDADDRLHPRFIERLLGPLLENPGLGYCYSYVQLFGAEDRLWRCPAYDPHRLLIENLSNPAAVVRRAAFDEVGGYHPDMVHGFEDWDFWIALLSVGYQGHLVPEPLLEYRRHPGGSMLTQAQTRREEIVQKIVERHRSLFNRMLETPTVDSRAMGFEDHLPALRVSAQPIQPFEPEEVWGGTIYQQLAAKAELEFIENSRFYRQVKKIKRSAPYRLFARYMYGRDWEGQLDSPNPREKLARIKASRAYRTIQAIKRTPFYRLYARYKYGPDSQADM